jgi:hypothetical protein
LQRRAQTDNPCAALPAAEKTNRFMKTLFPTPRAVQRAAFVLSRFSLLGVFLSVATANITNSLLLKYGFNDQPAHASKHASFRELMQGSAARPFAYRSLLPRIDYALAQHIVRRHPSLAASFEQLHLHRCYFADVRDIDWTPPVATAYTLMYFLILASTALGLFFVYRIARWRNLSFARALAFLCVYSFLFPLLFQRSVFFYDFFEFAGVFGAVYFFLEGWMFRCTAIIVLGSLVKETFFLVPIALLFLHKDEVPRSKRLWWLGVQLTCSLMARHLIMRGFEHNPGGMVEFHLWDNIAFWLNPKYYLDWNNLLAPGVFLPRLENPLLAVPIALAGRDAWHASEERWRRYFLAAFLPLLALFIVFGYGDMFRNFSLALPAVVLLALNAVTDSNKIRLISTRGYTTSE